MKKIVWLVLTALMVLSLVIAACGTKEEEEEKITEEGGQVITTKGEEEEVEEEEKEEVVTPVGEAKWWDKFGEPQFGDSINLCWNGANFGGDPYLIFNAPGAPGRMYLETLAFPDWTLDREDYPPGTFMFRGIPGCVLYNTLKGELAESWEKPDPTTYIFHIRQGVHYGLNPDSEASRLVNGREFTAYDVEYNWQRMLGLGSGYDKPSPYVALTQYTATKSVIATDKYTVEWKLSYPNLDCFETLIDARNVNMIVAREVIEKYGNANEWKNAVGTGPFILKNFTIDSCFTYVKNPNYWGYDERYPENKIPYVDEVKGLIIIDASTKLAALRTGKIPIMEGIDWEQAAGLAKTNPELQQKVGPSGAAVLYLRVDKAPFTDIRVRKALQMAVDIKTISKTYYGGYAAEIPPTLYNSLYPKEYSTPYDEWPEEVKAGYAYNPEGAKKLLAEAGYPQGFKTNCVAGSSASDYLQMLKSYFTAINVDMEIRLMDSGVFNGFLSSGKHDQMCFFGGAVSALFPPLVPLDFYYSKSRLNLMRGCVNDPVFDEIYMKAKTCLDETERAALCKQASDYWAAQQWSVNIPSASMLTIYQPWVKGYSGESIGESGTGFYCARLWIDQELKKSLGY